MDFASLQGHSLTQNTETVTLRCYGSGGDGQTRTSFESTTATSDQILKEGDNSEEKLIISLDFGTTYSGVAYAFSKSPDKVHVVTDWPGRPGLEFVKVPTLLKYDDDSCKTFKWGYEVDPTDAGTIRGIKLLLDPEKPKIHYGAEPKGDSKSPENEVMWSQVTTQSQLVRLHKSTKDIVGDYIDAIFKHALSVILGKQVPQYREALNRLPKEYVLTVPAIWSELAKQATLIAANRSGRTIQPRDLVTEPEAAALYTIQSFAKRGLSVGDGYVLCDAGGGTVDLISYEVVDINPLQLKEVSHATGGAVGSLMLNEGFTQHVRKVIGEEQFRELDEYAFREAVETFDSRIKKSFESREKWDSAPSGGRIFLGQGVKNDPDNNIARGYLKMTGEALERIFEPLVKEIEILVQAQLFCQGVFLVGGFGANMHLMEYLTKSLRTIEVLQPNDAWAAVVRGAAMSRLPQTIRVISNIAAKSYGTETNRFFREGIDGRDVGEHKFLDIYSGRYRVPEMRWYIQKGQELKRREPLKFQFYRDIPAEHKPEDLVFTDKLYESKAEIAPTHRWEGGVHAHCEVKSDFRGIDTSKLERKSKSDGTIYFSVHYDLVLTSRSAMMTFSAEYDGKTCGRSEVEY
ncbi:hypothetical protein K440DRAFT_559147 [Wilcoxina mikolae CBS 423.85]|nr:hypothetical protein K440DRAFT_559147 [Wilcoxina mikolae CBS 423.85]